MASTNGSSSSSPTEQVMALYEQMETQAAQAGESLVGSRGFSGLLGQMAENTAALTKLSADAMDLVLRNLRVAGRRDVVRLSRQLARTEDKLERVLQEVEELRDELARRGGPKASARTGEARTGEARTGEGEGEGETGDGETGEGNGSRARGSVRASARGSRSRAASTKAS